MSDLTTLKKGSLRDGWTAELNDYAISCEWALNGDILLAGDITGNINGLEGTSGNPLWQLKKNMKGYLRLMSIQEVNHLRQREKMVAS